MFASLTVGGTRFELVTSTMPTWRSNQLSYSRVPPQSNRPVGLFLPTGCPPDRPSARSGGEGDRTPDLVNAIHALSQLSYAPVILGPAKRVPAGTRHLIWTL